MTDYELRDYLDRQAAYKDEPEAFSKVLAEFINRHSISKVLDLIADYCIHKSEELDSADWSRAHDSIAEAALHFIFVDPDLE